MDKRRWDPIDWQNFSKRLVQLRHGAHNVQTVPDKVNGDAGIEFFTLDGCLYQCYAPQEAVDVKKASSAMREKATADLGKLFTYKDAILGITGAIKISRWILLCPFLDDKSVIAHISKKVSELNCGSLPFCSPDIAGLVHSLEDFETELARLRSQSAGIPIHFPPPSISEVDDAETHLGSLVDKKLERGFPDDNTATRVKRRRAYLKSALRRSNLLDQLRLEYPEMWDTWSQIVSLEEERLSMTGPVYGKTEEVIQAELKRLEEKLGDNLESLPATAVTALAIGQIGTWLIECPLDFA